MKRLTIWIDKNRKKVWFAVGLNVLILALMLLVMSPSFESNDDTTMCQMVNGSLGVYDAHIMFQNYLLGFLYKTLYMAVGAIPWYAIVQYVVLLTAFSAVTYVILQKMDHYCGLCVTVILLIFFAYECYFKLQFTKTAGIAGGASVLLLLYAVSREKVSWKMILFGELFGAVGSMFRYRQFLACGALMAGVGVYLVLELGKNFRGQCVRRLCLYAATFGGLLAVVFGLHAVDTRFYSGDEDWAYYVQFNKYRAQLVDRSFPDYDTCEDLYLSLGLNRDAYNLYKGLDINDPDKFTLEIEKSLVAAKPKQQLTKAFIERFLKDLTPYHFETPMFYCFLLMFLLWLFWGEHRWRAVLAVLGELAAFELVYFYMFYDGRYLINRVDVGLWFSASLVMIWLLKPEKVRMTRQSGVLLCLVVLLVDQRYWKESWRVNCGGRDENKAAQREVLETLSADKDHIYLAKIINTISVSDSYGPFDTMPTGLLDNISWLGGWTTNMVPYKKILGNYGLQNPYKDMIGNEKVRLIDNNIELTMRYLHEYYDEKAEAVCVGEVGKYKLYQIK